MSADTRHSSGSSFDERVSRSSSRASGIVDQFPRELLSSTRNDTLGAGSLTGEADSMQGAANNTTANHTDMSRPGEEVECETRDRTEVMSTGSLKFGYVAGVQIAEMVDLGGEGSQMLDDVIIEDKYGDDSDVSTCCEPCAKACLRCCAPCLYKQHPPHHPSTRCQRCRYALMCPPHGAIGHALSLALAAALAWAVLWAIAGSQALPGGNLFALFLLIVLGHVAGKFVEVVCRGPALLGMLVVGFCLRNVPGVAVAEDIDPAWAINIVSIALVVILVRAGLGLDPSALRRLSLVVFRLAFSPCLAETLTVAVASHFILGFPWAWGFMLGFVLGAVSPAVVVPSMLSLSARGLGVAAGIPTLVIAAASVDDVLAISGFGVLLGVAFSTGNLWLTLVRGPLEALVGVVYGVLLGLLFWLLPNHKDPLLTVLRFCLLLLGGLFAVLGSASLRVPGAGALGCLTVAFVAGLRFRREQPGAESDAKSSLVWVEEAFELLWQLLQALLFGLIGAEVDLDSVQLSRVGLSLAVLGIGLSVRCVVSFFAVTCTPLTLKERIFIIGSWLPKATVQAAIGAVALNTARTQPETSENYEQNIALGTDILTMAVLAIVITAPLGAIVIAVTAPLLLSKEQPTSR